MSSTGDLTAELRAMIADLDGYIDRRAAEFAAPQIAAAEQKHRGEIADQEARNQRLEDLIGELRRLRKVREDQLEDAYRDIVRLLDLAPPDHPLVKGITYRRGPTIERVRREALAETSQDGIPAQLLCGW